MASKHFPESCPFPVNTRNHLWDLWMHHTPFKKMKNNSFVIFKPSHITSGFKVKTMSFDPKLALVTLYLFIYLFIEPGEPGGTKVKWLYHSGFRYSSSQKRVRPLASLLLHIPEAVVQTQSARESTLKGIMSFINGRTKPTVTSWQEHYSSYITIDLMCVRHSVNV